MGHAQTLACGTNVLLRRTLPPKISGCYHERTVLSLSQRNVDYDTEARRFVSNSRPAVPSSTQFCSHRQRTLATYQLHARQLSLSAANYSVSDKIGKMYMKRDIWKMKRAEFYKRFAAARFVKAAPDSVKPYLELTRVDKPIGTWLLYLPCAFGISLASPVGTLPSLYYLGLFGVGAFFMRGAGCIINDLWDKDLDKHVERTRSRPLASGKLKPRNAVALLAAHLSISLGILLSLNNTCILIGVASMLPVVLYPLAKRVTYFPQAALGLTFNVGAIMGYAAVAGQINWSVVMPLYIGCFLWTMYYDTIYAVQDAGDDLKVGIKSTALLFLASKDTEELMRLPIRERLTEMNESMAKLQSSLAVCYGATMMSWMLAFVSAGCGYPAFFFPITHMLKCTKADQNVSNPELCWEKFVESRNTGLMVLAGIIAGVYMSYPVG